MSDEWITIQEAARRLQVPERTVASWRKNERITYRSYPRQRPEYAVSWSSVQSYADSRPSYKPSRVDQDLQEALAQAEAKIVRLTTQIALLDKPTYSSVPFPDRERPSLGIQDTYSAYSPTPAPSASIPSLLITRGTLPEGTIRIMDMARLHDVAPGTLKSQVDRNRSLVTRVPTGARDNRADNYATPVQQAEIIALWRGNGTAYTLCMRTGCACVE